MKIDIDVCKRVGIEPKEVDTIITGFLRYINHAENLGIEVFGVDGRTITLRVSDQERICSMIIADTHTTTNKKH